jgi:hypothetical protein
MRGAARTPDKRRIAYRRLHPDERSIFKSFSLSHDTPPTGCCMERRLATAVGFCDFCRLRHQLRQQRCVRSPAAAASTTVMEFPSGCFNVFFVLRTLTFDRKFLVAVLPSAGHIGRVDKAFRIEPTRRCNNNSDDEERKSKAQSPGHTRDRPSAMLREGGS